MFGFVRKSRFDAVCEQRDAVARSLVYAQEKLEAVETYVKGKGEALGQALNAVGVTQLHPDSVFGTSPFDGMVVRVTSTTAEQVLKSLHAAFTYQKGRATSLTQTIDQLTEQHRKVLVALRGVFGDNFDAGCDSLVDAIEEAGEHQEDLLDALGKVRHDLDIAQRSLTYSRTVIAQQQSLYGDALREKGRDLAQTHQALSRALDCGKDNLEALRNISRIVTDAGFAVEIDGSGTAQLSDAVSGMIYRLQEDAKLASATKGPMLGLATTQELLDEIDARNDLLGVSSYRPTEEPGMCGEHAVNGVAASGVGPWFSDVPAERPIPREPVGYAEAISAAAGPEPVAEEEPAPLFRIGDKVRLVVANYSDQNGNDFKAGVTYIAGQWKGMTGGNRPVEGVCVDTDGDLHVEKDESGGWGFAPAQLFELVPLEWTKGAKVRSVSDTSIDIALGEEFVLTDDLFVNRSGVREIHFLDSTDYPRERNADDYELVA